MHELWIVIECDYWGNSAGCYRIKFSYLIAGIGWKYSDFLSFFSRAVYWFVIFWSCSKCIFISSQCKLVALFWNSPFPLSITEYKEGIWYKKLKINSEHWESMKKNIKYWRTEIWCFLKKELNISCKPDSLWKDNVHKGTKGSSYSLVFI